MAETKARKKAAPARPTQTQTKAPIVARGDGLPAAKPGVTLEWLRSALFAEGLTISKADVFDHEGDRIFELQLSGPARQFEIARAALLSRDEVLNVVFE